MISLTRPQRATLVFICGHFAAHMRAPSLEEIRAGLGYASKASVQRLLDQLEDRGAIGRSGRGNTRRITMFRVVPIPRAPDGAPLHPVRLPAREEARA